MIRGGKEMDREQNISKSQLYNEKFFYDEPFYRKDMSAEEFLSEKEYLNENMEAFWDGSYVPLWRQEIMRKREFFRKQAWRQNY
jgi:hypothetical protein